MQPENLSIKTSHVRVLYFHLIRSIFCGALILGFSNSVFAWTTWIGVVEDWPTKDPADSKQIRYESRVRPLFVRVDQSAWQSAPQDELPRHNIKVPKTFSWDVCFSGRGEGALTTNMTEPLPFTSVPPYTLRESENAPWRTRRSLDYSSSNLEPVYKPIVLSSSMNSSCKDPEKWKAGSSQKVNGQIQQLMTILSAKLDGEETKKLLPLTSGKIAKTWANKSHDRIAILKAKTANGEIVTGAFYLGAETPALIGVNTLMIDAGDFDSDGKVDVIFKQRNQKNDAYFLYNGGTKVVESVW
ncbi:MAG: hypothetical protein NTV34_17265 [Proteobacteria bacterium]|nr:hypothetical protein [Pseudomonadota bacterium]